MKKSWINTCKTIVNKEINVFRDDLFPFFGGGNKGRKMFYIEKDIEENECNALVTTGGIQSNHCRATAMMAAANSWKCTIIYHGDKSRFYTEKGNAQIVRNLDVDVKFVESTEIGSAMDDAMENYRINGFNPYYIYGGGHNIAGGLAYVDAIRELKEECEDLNWKPKYIFVASGTGSTQGGILAGLELIGWQDVKVIGISVARKNPRGKVVVEEFYQVLRKKLDLNSTELEVVFDDNYLHGGYESTDDLSMKIVDDFSARTGLLFDNTYSGKAIIGMLDYLERNNKINDILFWHTGGIFNLMA